MVNKKNTESPKILVNWAGNVPILVNGVHVLQGQDTPVFSSSFTFFTDNSECFAGIEGLKEGK